jgi:FkbM family methyltransferase
MLRDELYNLTPLMSRLFGFLGRIHNRFSDNFRFLKLIMFWHEHPDEFKFTNKGQAIVKDLAFAFKVKDISLEALELYFQTRSKYSFHNENGDIFMKIGKLEFLLPFPYGIFELCEIFQENCYELFDVKGRVVVDVGAFIGGSAIYFASKGAKKIVAFEPNPDVAEIARRNVMLNGLEDRIRVRTKAVAAKPGKRPFFFKSFHPGASSFRAEVGAKQLQVDTVSLSNIIHELGHVGLLKMDCEGAEYEILPAAYAEGALRDIDNMALEVHGSSEPIINILSQAGFDIVKDSQLGSGVKIDPKSFVLFAKKEMLTEVASLAVATAYGSKNKIAHYRTRR